VDSYGQTTYYNGVVDSIVSDNGKLYATVGTVGIDFDTIVSISETAPGGGSSGEGSEPGDADGSGDESAEGEGA